MGLTKSEIQDRVLREAQIPDDSGAASVLAQADILNYIDERARDIWGRRSWREYLILGSFSVPADTHLISLSSITPDSSFAALSGYGGYSNVFAEVKAIREGTTPFLPEDADAINTMQADLWASTTTPVQFVNLGKRGIYLLGTFTTATTLNFFGKADFSNLETTDQWILGNDLCLIYGATADLIRANDRDTQRSLIWEQRFNAEIQKLIDLSEVQAASIKRFIPGVPWTDLQNTNQFDTSVTGTSLY